MTSLSSLIESKVLIMGVSEMTIMRGIKDLNSPRTHRQKSSRRSWDSSGQSQTLPQPERMNKSKPMEFRAIRLRESIVVDSRLIYSFPRVVMIPMNE